MNINITDGTLPSGISRKNGIHVQRTGNACEAFVMTCRQAAVTKPTV